MLILIFHAAILPSFKWFKEPALFSVTCLPHPEKCHLFDDDLQSSADNQLTPGDPTHPVATSPQKGRTPSFSSGKHFVLQAHS